MRLAEIVTSPQFLNLDHANLRRGLRAACRNRKMSSVFGTSNLDHANLRRGSRAHRRNRKMSLVFLSSTTRISAEGRARLAEIVKSPQFLNLDHANLRRGSRAACRNRKKSPVFEPRPRESPQRVARGLQKS